MYYTGCHEQRLTLHNDYHLPDPSSCSMLVLSPACYNACEKKKRSGAPSPRTWTVSRRRNIQSNCRMIISSHWNEITKPQPLITHMGKNGLMHQVQKFGLFLKGGASNQIAEWLHHHIGMKSQSTTCVRACLVSTGCKVGHLNENQKYLFVWAKYLDLVHQSVSSHMHIMGWGRD